MDLQSLHRLTDVASQAPVALDIYVEGLAAVIAVMRADRAAILELDEQGGMRFSAWTGLSNEYRARALLRLPWAENADDWSAVLVRDVDADAALSRERAHLRAEGIGALVYVPLIDDGRLFGAIAGYWNAPREFSDDDVERAEFIATQIMWGVKRLRAAAALAKAAERERAARADAEVAREQAETAARAAREWLAILGHELRNPLNALLNAALVVEREETPSAMRALASAIVRRQVASLSRLLEDLLDETRISRGLVALRREVVDLRTAARLAVEELSYRLAGQSHDFQIALSDEPILVTGDATRLQQVVGNLLDNALKYTPAGGWIRLEVGARGEEAIIRIRDGGRGIPADRLESIFQPFAQGTQDHLLGRAGLGLGLSLVKRIVELHGGHVWAASEGLGRGAEFTVSLPRSEAVVTAPARAESRG